MTDGPSEPVFRRPPPYSGPVLPEPPERILDLRQSGLPSAAEMAWRRWCKEFNRPRRPRPLAVVRCSTDSAEILGEVRRIDGRLILGLGHANCGFERFHILATPNEGTKDARLAAEPKWSPLCDRHPSRNPEEQLATIIRRLSHARGKQSIRVLV